MDAGRTSLTQEVRLVPALVLLKSRTKVPVSVRAAPGAVRVCRHQNCRHQVV